MRDVKPQHPKRVEVPDDWRVDDAAELYRVPAWGDGFFAVNADGHVAVRPFEDSELEIDIMDVVSEMRQRGVRFPVLFRFQDVLRARVRRLNVAFAEAIRDAGYGSSYRAIYPIKVNQLHEVVEEVLDAGKPFGLGLECGSRAELVATLPHLVDDETPLVCNGVKDRSMLSLVLAGQEIGKNIIPVMEKYAEFEELIDLANETGAVTQFGVRVRLRTAGAGKWAESGGYQSKFGISLPELMQVVQRLGDESAAHRLVLLHFHLGSQISHIAQLRQAARELAQTYAELVLAGLPIRYIDVGGGLGVNYTGDFDENSVDYGLQEYANSVVGTIRDVCDDRGVPHPVLLSESGRAITAHHSVLVVEALGAYQKDRAGKDYEITADAHRTTQNLDDLLERLRLAPAGDFTVRDLVEAYHDVVELHEEAAARYGLGVLSLAENALIERMYWSCCRHIHDRMLALEPDPAPPEMDELAELLVDHYLLDFSVFQSVLDHWAIQQQFPIVPLHRLDERPTRRAMLVDLTCDSDGRIKEYVSSGSDNKYLDLHALQPGKPYCLGFFLMGAYQDIMGDAHNLFGRVSEAHVYGDADEPRNFWIEKVIPGAKVEDMLAQVQYFPNDLQRRMQEQIKAKIDAGVIRPKRGIEILDQYKASLSEETYLENYPKRKG